jgi:hypothetical protein
MTFAGAFGGQGELAAGRSAVRRVVGVGDLGEVLGADGLICSGPPSRASLAVAGARSAVIQSKSVGVLGLLLSSRSASMRATANSVSPQPLRPRPAAAAVKAIRIIQRPPVRRSIPDR